MPSLITHPIQRQIIGLTLSILAIVAILITVNVHLDNESDHIRNQLENQEARRDIGVSIYQRLFAAKAYVYKLSVLDNLQDLDVAKKRFDSNLGVIIRGVSILQNGGIFEDDIATNIPGQDVMHLLAKYRPNKKEGYVLEVLELGPVIHSLDEKVTILYDLLAVRSINMERVHDELDNRIQNLVKAVDTILQRSQENAARVLYESHDKHEKLYLDLTHINQLHENIRLPLTFLALFFAAYLLITTLLRVGNAITQRKQAEDQLHLLLNTTVEGIYGVDQEGNTTFVNPAASRMLGFAPEELIGHDNHEMIHHTKSDGSHYPADECRMLEVLKSGEMQTVENEIFWRRDGSSFPVEYSSTPIWRDNEIEGAVINFHDISERKRSEENIRTLSQAIEQSPVSVLITDRSGNIEYVNTAFEKNTGYSQEEVVGENPRILKSGITSKAIYHELWKTISSGNAWQGEMQNRNKDGEIFWEHANIAPVLDESGNIVHYLAVKEDITHRKQQEERILYQAHFDALTDLPNRFLSLDRLSQLVNEAKRTNELVAVLFLDLDDFKKINDSLGHDTGDKLLVEAAQRLTGVIRGGDTVGRLGGDEFIILLGGLDDAADASSVVENLLECFRDPFIINGRELIMTASVGVSVYPNDGEQPSELLRNADSAMYHSKDQGRNTYHYFTDAMNQKVSRRLLLEEQMHGALNRGEFRLCYQPQIDINSRHIIGTEALLRWNNPALGKVSPDEFIPIAEQTGLIVPLGEFVLTEALAMLARWNLKFNRKLTMAINLSPRQFRSPDLVASVEEAMQKSGITGESLELEITEGVLMSGQDYIEEALVALNDLGIGISMDDFGTGYSSLSYLRSYPFDTLKIDRSFVSDITVDAADRELVNATITMAHGLGLKVVAEGVETEEQLSLLAAQGCEYAQGNLFSKPVPADEIMDMLEPRRDYKIVNSEV